MPNVSLRYLGGRHPKERASARGKYKCQAILMAAVHGRLWK